MIWRQSHITLAPRPRGVHLITGEVTAQLAIADVAVGLVHLFIQHTSASLALNENASPEVRRDLERFLRRLVPDGAEYFEHVLEGPDDMPAHVKAVLVGASLTLPIAQGRLALGRWQGIYLCEHREQGGSRQLIATAFGSGAPTT
jgi:secondary thiamine-phosphate synthase enzyme